MPLLFTYRTAAELAGVDDTPADYGDILEAAFASGQVDMADLELRRDPVLLSCLLDKARQAGVKILLSLHDFRGTPPVAGMIEDFLEMERRGADMAKLAVTPRCPEDVLALLAAAQQGVTALGIPLAAMSMGQLGMITRLGGGVFGSSMTFGAAKKQSAPGQPPVNALKEALDMLYGD